MKAKCTRGFATVKNPLTGEDIDVQEPFETDRATFEALDAEYPGMVIVEPDNEDTNPGSEAGETGGTDADDGEATEGDGSETKTPTCGVNGCSRTVDSPEDTCWQHPKD